jgi:hypothetical protein
VNDEASLGVEKETEELVGLLDLDDVWRNAKQFLELQFCHRNIVKILTHEASREGGVSSNLVVHLDETLHQNVGNLLLGKGILQSVSEKNDERQALTELVRSSRGTRSLITKKKRHGQRSNSIYSIAMKSNVLIHNYSIIRSNKRLESS